MAIDKRFYPEPDPNQGSEKFSNGPATPRGGIYSDNI
jgi:hypothetical protein